MTAFHWAILGTGQISRNFVLGLPACKTMTAAAITVASRTQKNADLFSRELRIPSAAATYQQAISTPAVDAVYIATPPSEHERLALAAIDAGKAVLVEKPFAMDGPAAARIAAAARQKNVFCMEGMWTRFLPLVRSVRERILRGDIGTPRAFRADFLACNRPDASVSVFDPARGGGALMYRGIYGVSLARFFLGPIDEVQATATIGTTDVDEDCTVTLRHRSGAISTIRASLRTAGINDATVHGTAGSIHLESPLIRPFVARMTRFQSSTGKMRGGGRFERLKANRLVQQVRQRVSRWAPAFWFGSGVRIANYYSGNGLAHEADAVMHAVRNGATESPVMPLDESIEIMHIIDLARTAWTQGARQ
jgi:predicted dehydrogenase